MNAKVRDIPPRERLFTVTGLAAELGVTARTLRFYEDRGLISPQRLGPNRVYSPRDRARMILILRGKQLGFSLKEIAEYLDLYDPAARRRPPDCQARAAAHCRYRDLGRPA